MSCVCRKREPEQLRINNSCLVIRAPFVKVRGPAVSWGKGSLGVPAPPVWRAGGEGTSEPAESQIWERSDEGRGGVGWGGGTWRKMQ